MIALRDADEGDKPYILTRWSMAIARGHGWLAKREGDAFGGVQRSAIARLLNRSRCVVAHAEDEPKLLVGFAAYESHKRIVHFVYVADAFRREGLARRMLEPMVGDKPVTFTEWLPACAALPVPKSWVYDPRRSI